MNNREMRRFVILLIGLYTIVSCNKKQEKSGATKSEVKKPNIVLVYVDDLGYADVGAYGAKGVSTPNVDKLAKEGVVFTDGHCSASTCTPSRYSLLTGSYAFRNNAAILEGDAPLIISENTKTMPQMLQKAGYKTAIVGKWHLGLGDGNVNWNEEIKPGPLERGFDYSFIIPATGDRVPCVFVENHNVVGLDKNDPITVSYGKPIEGVVTGKSNPELLRMTADGQHNKTIVNGVSRIGYQSGGKSALWKDEEFADILTGKAKKFIVENKDNPFFIYFAFHDIHVPRVPNERFVGKSEMGSRGDAIVQMDWMTGEIVKVLEENGLAENTLIIFSSDNGPILNDGYGDKAVELVDGHKPGGPYRGAKYSVYEAGTRVPTIAYWPGTIKPGVSDALISQIDLYATFAKLVGEELDGKEAPDSHEMLDTWLGKSKTGREYLIEEALTLGLRKDNWKYVLPAPNTRDWTKSKGIESGISDEEQLYNLATDPSESENVYSQQEEMVQELKQKLNGMKEAGGTRPGLM